jgi:hypothetical protein
MNSGPGADFALLLIRATKCGETAILLGAYCRTR